MQTTGVSPGPLRTQLRGSELVAEVFALFEQLDLVLQALPVPFIRGLGESEPGFVERLLLVSRGGVRSHQADMDGPLVGKALALIGRPAPPGPSFRSP